jgi:hypothetical protein
MQAQEKVDAHADGAADTNAERVAQRRTDRHVLPGSADGLFLNFAGPIVAQPA